MQHAGPILVAALLCPMAARAAAPVDGGDSTPPAPSFASSRSLLFGHLVERDGLHFQIAFGIGGGPDSEGLFHAMELGGTFANGWTLALLHTFIQSRGIGQKEGGPDLFGGWMAQLKVPLFYPELDAKMAFGLGGLHDQSDGIRAIPGVGWSYGFDFHMPIFAASGITLGVQMLHAFVEDRHYFGGATSLGYTFF